MAAPFTVRDPCPLRITAATTIPVVSRYGSPEAGSAVTLAPVQIGRDTETRGALFLRADRLEGTEARVTAEGHVELRSRRETVLADSLSYAIPEQTIYGEGNVVLRRGYDWITGPQVEYKRDTEVGFFREPQFFVSEANARGDAKEIRFTGPDHYEATDASYTTCVAAHPDWYLLGEELEVDNLRKVGTARRVSVHFLDVPVLYAPWLQFPLSNERKSGFLTPTLGSTGVRGFEATAPYYLNLAPNYDATITPRLMTKRGLQLGAQFRYLLGEPEDLFGVAAGEMNAEILPHDRVTGENRYALAWKHTEQFAPCRQQRVVRSRERAVRAVARWLFQHQQGLGRQLFRRFRRPRRRDVAEDAAARCRTRRDVGTVVAARARAELPDAAGSECAGRAAL